MYNEDVRQLLVDTFLPILGWTFCMVTPVKLIRRTRGSHGNSGLTSPVISFEHVDNHDHYRYVTRAFCSWSPVKQRLLIRCGIISPTQKPDQLEFV